MVVHNTIEVTLDINPQIINAPQENVQELIPFTKMNSFNSCLFLYYLTHKIEIQKINFLLEYIKSFELKRFDPSRKGCQNIDAFDFS